MKDLFTEANPADVERFKADFLAKIPPDCPMDNWIPAVEALPDTAKLHKCAVEWVMLVENAFEIFMKEKGVK